MSALNSSTRDNGALTVHQDTENTTGFALCRCCIKAITNIDMPIDMADRYPRHSDPVLGVESSLGMSRNARYTHNRVKECAKNRCCCAMKGHEDHEDNICLLGQTISMTMKANI